MSVPFTVRLLTAALLGGQLVGACMLEREGSQETPPGEPGTPHSDSTEGISGADPLTPAPETGALGTPLTDSGLQTDSTSSDAGTMAATPVLLAPSDPSLSVPPAAGQTPSVASQPAAAPTPAPASPARETSAPISGPAPAPAPASPAAPAQPQPAPPPPQQMQPASSTPPPPAQSGFRLSSSAFDPWGALPSLYACDGVPPPLRWESAPAGTAAYVLSFAEITGTGRRTLWAIQSIPGNIDGLYQDFRSGLLSIESSRCIPGARYEYTLYALSRAPSGVSQTVTRTEIISGQVLSPDNPPDGVLGSTTLPAYFTGR